MLRAAMPGTAPDAFPPTLLKVRPLPVRGFLYGKIMTPARLQKTVFQMCNKLIIIFI